MNIFWTMQSREMWRRFEASGRLRCSINEADPYLVPAYKWMSRQMEKRIGPAPATDSSPVWAWYQYLGEGQKKPDRRDYGDFFEAGARAVEIEFLASEKEVLLSDYELWHFVMNGSRLPLSLREVSDGLGSAKRPGNRDEPVEQNWPKIFEIDWFVDGITVPRHRKSIQACLWQVEARQVIEVTHLISKRGTLVEQR